MSKTKPSNVTRLATIVDSVKGEFGLDDTDIQILGLMAAKWGEGKDVRVTDLTLKFGKELASPANIHYRLTKDLVDLKLIKLETSEEDARVKHILKGVRFKALEAYVGELL
jgi:hypothetical protein